MNKFNEMEDPIKWRILENAARHALKETGYESKKISGEHDTTVWTINKHYNSERASVSSGGSRSFLAFVLTDEKTWKNPHRADIIIVSTVNDLVEPNSIEVYQFNVDDIWSRIDQSYLTRIKTEQQELYKCAVWIDLDTDNRDLFSNGNSKFIREHTPFATYPLKFFPLVSQDLEDIKSIMTLIKNSISYMSPYELRVAAAALLALERMPISTHYIDLIFSFMTTNNDGNYGWAKLEIFESEFRLDVGEHFYDPAVGGDTESRTIFETHVNSDWREGDIQEWLEFASAISMDGKFSVGDESIHDDVEWEYF